MNQKQNLYAKPPFVSATAGKSILSRVEVSNLNFFYDNVAIFLKPSVASGLAMTSIGSKYHCVSLLCRSHPPPDKHAKNSAPDLRSRAPHNEGVLQGIKK